MKNLTKNEDGSYTLTFSQIAEEIKQQSVQQSLREQMAEEVNETTPAKTNKMMLQKYGLISPQFTASEKNLIIREDRLNYQCRTATGRSARRGDNR